MALRYSIESRNREMEVAPARATDFTLTAPEGFRARQILESGEAAGARFTLYCLDTEDETAIFVETALDFDLEAAPFFYAAQYEGAQAVIKLSKSELFELAAQTEDPGPRLAWIQSVGRSGTTLASRALATCDGVWSLSEPDVLMQLLTFRPETRGERRGWSCETDKKHDRLTDACMRVLCHETMRQGAHDRFVIKPRSLFCEAFPTVGRLYPASETLFLYREPLGWIESCFSAYFRDRDCDDPEFLQSFEDSFRSYVPLIESRIVPGKLHTLGALWALHYVSALQKFDEAREAGLPMMKLSFEELQEGPRAHFEGIFNKWGLRWNDEALTDVLAKDSQAGSGLGRSSAGRAEHQVNPRYIDNARAVFEEFGLLS